MKGIIEGMVAGVFLGVVFIGGSCIGTPTEATPQEQCIEKGGVWYEQHGNVKPWCYHR